jgi:hypothetical protein
MGALSEGTWSIDLPVSRGHGALPPNRVARLHRRTAGTGSADIPAMDDRAELEPRVLADVCGGARPEIEVAKMTIGWLRTRRNPVVRATEYLLDGTKITTFTNHAKTIESPVGAAPFNRTILPDNFHERSEFFLGHVRDAIRAWRGR